MMSSDYHLIDIPSSLLPKSFKCFKARSSKAPDQPRNECKPKRSEVKWPQAEDLRRIHSRYGDIVEEALKAAYDEGVSQWCEERIECSGESEETQDLRQWQETFRIMESFGQDTSTIYLSNGVNKYRLEEIHGRTVLNPLDEMVVLTLALELPQTYYIPAHSTFVWDTFPSASSVLTGCTLNTSRFDLIVMDPPWNNKSVKRLKRKRDLSFNTVTNCLTQLPPIGNWLAEGGIVAIWCTNNIKIINQVQDILFKRWRVELVAEWVWLKVTSQGKPVVDLSSSFRKPYEILLLARKAGDASVVDIPNSKVIIAVPSFHSQKPCLKGAFDSILPSEYRGCELYARNLVEGWMSVGDECLKFMREDNWQGIPESKEGAS